MLYNKGKRNLAFYKLDLNNKMKELFNNILLFDGDCNLCNGVVQFIIKRDKLSKFKFTSLQSKIGQQILSKLKLSNNHFDSFIYVKNQTVYLKSTAALQILKDIGGMWKLLYMLIVVPTTIRDYIYSFIANNRYRFFGKANNCMLPTAELKERFL